jgi:hypothetical protein
LFFTTLDESWFGDHKRFSGFFCETKEKLNFDEIILGVQWLFTSLFVTIFFNRIDDAITKMIKDLVSVS